MEPDETGQPRAASRVACGRARSICEVAVRAGSRRTAERTRRDSSLRSGPGGVVDDDDGSFSQGAEQIQAVVSLAAPVVTPRFARGVCGVVALSQRESIGEASAREGAYLSDVFDLMGAWCSRVFDPDDSGLRAVRGREALARWRESQPLPARGGRQCAQREHARACVQFETLGTSLEPFPDALCGWNVAKPLCRSANERIGEGRDAPPERA